jgi:hypothetical protein
MKPCCETLADLAALAGQRGISVRLPGGGSDPLDGDIPKLVFRSVDAGLEDKVSGPPDLEITLEARVGFTYCPWCGNRLADPPARAGRLLGWLGR